MWKLGKNTVHGGGLACNVSEFLSVSYAMYGRLRLSWRLCRLCWRSCFGYGTCSCGYELVLDGSDIA